MKTSLKQNDSQMGQSNNNNDTKATAKRKKTTYSSRRIATLNDDVRNSSSNGSSSDNKAGGGYYADCSSDSAYSVSSSEESNTIQNNENQQRERCTSISTATSTTSQQECFAQTLVSRLSGVNVDVDANVVGVDCSSCHHHQSDKNQERRIPSETTENKEKHEESNNDFDVFSVYSSSTISTNITETKVMKSTTAVCTKHHSNAMIMARKLLGIASSKSDQDTHYNSNSSFKKEEVDDVLSLNTTPTNDPIITTNDLRSSTKFKTTTSQQQQQQKQEQMTPNHNCSIENSTTSTATYPHPKLDHGHAASFPNSNLTTTATTSFVGTIQPSSENYNVNSSDNYLGVLSACQPFFTSTSKKVITKNIIASSDYNVTSYNSDTSSDCDVVGHHPQQQHQESNSSSHEEDRQIVMTKTGDDEQLLETSKIVDNINEQHQFLKNRKSISTKISNNNPIMILQSQNNNESLSNNLLLSTEQKVDHDNNAASISSNSKQQQEEEEEMKIVSLSENTTGTSSSNNNTTTSSGSGTGSGNDTFGDEITDNNKLNRESHNNSSSGENNGCGDVNISEEDNNNNNSIQDGGCYFEQVENKKFHVNKKQKTNDPLNVVNKTKNCNGGNDHCSNNKSSNLLKNSIPIYSQSYNNKSPSIDHPQQQHQLSSSTPFEYYKRRKINNGANNNVHAHQKSINSHDNNSMNTTTEERLAIKKKKRMVNRKKYEEEVRRNQNDSSADGENSDTFFEEESFDPNQPISLEDALSFTKISRLIVQSSPPFIAIHANAAFYAVTESQSVIGQPISSLLALPDKIKNSTTNKRGESHKDAASTTPVENNAICTATRDMFCNHNSSHHFNNNKSCTTENFLNSGDFDQYFIVNALAISSESSKEAVQAGLKLDCLLSVCPIVSSLTETTGMISNFDDDQKKVYHCCKTKKNHGSSTSTTFSGNNNRSRVLNNNNNQVTTTGKQKRGYPNSKDERSGDQQCNSYCKKSIVTHYLIQLEEHQGRKEAIQVISSPLATLPIRNKTIIETKNEPPPSCNREVIIKQQQQDHYSIKSTSTPHYGSDQQSKRQTDEGEFTMNLSRSRSINSFIFCG